MSARLVGVLGRGLVDAAEPVLRADDLGLNRGDGCFETCRVVTGADGRSLIDNLPAHLDRLARSARAMEIPADLDGCRALIEQVADAWREPGEAAIRLLVTRGSEDAGTATVVATIHAINPESLRQRREGVRVVTLTRGTPAAGYADAPWLLGGVKSLSYAVNMAALREAARRGAEDAIWLSSEGTVLEAPTATVVWRSDDRLLTTPAGASGILRGTTMAALFAGAAGEGLRTGSAVVAAAELAEVDAIWLVSAVRGVAEVIDLDGVPRVPRPELTARLGHYAGF